jgi:hypothetical protein
MLGDITFPTKPGVTPKPVPLVRLGTVSSEVFLARAIESGGRYL